MRRYGGFALRPGGPAAGARADQETRSESLAASASCPGSCGVGGTLAPRRIAISISPKLGRQSTGMERRPYSTASIGDAHRAEAVVAVRNLEILRSRFSVGIQPRTRGPTTP